MAYTLGSMSFFSGREDLAVTGIRGSLVASHAVPSTSQEVLLECWMNMLRDVVISLKASPWKGTSNLELVIPDKGKDGRVCHKQLLRVPYSEVASGYKLEFHLFKDLQENLFLYVILNNKIAYTDLNMRSQGYKAKTGELTVGTGDTKFLDRDVYGNILLRGSPIGDKYTKELAEEYFQKLYSVR